MAYTAEERKAVYAEVSDKLTDAAVLLRGFIDAESELKPNEQPSEEIRFVQSTANTLMSAVGNCKVREKQTAADSESA